MIARPTNNQATSDLPTPDQNEWLEEPTLPKKDDFKDPENFEFAFGEYKKKMATYQARLQLHKACEEVEAEKLKDPFLCLMYEFDPKTGQPKVDPRTGLCIHKKYPSYGGFIHENDDGKKEPFK